MQKHKKIIKIGGIAALLATVVGCAIFFSSSLISKAGQVNKTLGSVVQLDALYREDSVFDEVFWPAIIPYVRANYENVENLSDDEIYDQVLSAFSDQDWSEFFADVEAYYQLQRVKIEGVEFTLMPVGSGTIISSDGLILTNHHVIEGQEKMGVCFTTSEFYIAECSEIAEIIVSDANKDLALLYPTNKINALEQLVEIKDSERNYPAVTFSTDSVTKDSLPKISDEIFVVGYPVEAIATEQVAVTKGIITGYDSGYVDAPNEIDLVTDATINGGNSGGAAFDKYNLFIGIPYMGTEWSAGGEYAYIRPLTIINSWLKSLVEDEVLEKNPVKYFKGTKFTSEEKQFINIEEKQKNIEQTQQQYKDELDQLHSAFDRNENKLKTTTYVTYGVLALGVLLLIFGVRLYLKQNNKPSGKTSLVDSEAKNQLKDNNTKPLN